MIDEALRYIGIGMGKADEKIKRKVEETFLEVEKCALPKSVYGLFEIGKNEESVQLVGTTCSIKSRDLCKLFENSKSCIILAATLGIKTDIEISRRQKISMLDAMIFDACCSVMIDKVCDEAEQKLMQQLEEGQYFTMRFSPGYGDVPLEASRDILRILNADRRIGLSLTASDMLVPTKSITALIGVSSKKENRQKSCRKCNLVKTCMYRRRGDKCGL